MNPGLLKEVIEILDYVFEDGKYKFKKINTVRANAEMEFKKHNYSKFGVGSDESTKFTLRHIKDLSVTNAIKFKDKHYLISSVEDLENKHRYDVIVAIKNKPRIFTLKRYVIEKDITFNRPTKVLKTIYNFEGYITEKYTGYAEEKVNTISTKKYILIVPKIIDLEIGDILVMDNKSYNIQDLYKLNEELNEYEIVIERDN